MKSALPPSRATLLLDHADISELLTLPRCIAVVESAYGAYARGEVPAPAIMHVDAEGGEFHVKGGLIRGSQCYFALKANGGFFQNPARNRLPAIQGLILLSDGSNGCPLAVMDSRAITVMRTAAATAVAASRLALPEINAVTLCGCGGQAEMQLRALREVRAFEKVYVWSIRPEEARAFADRVGVALGLDVQVVGAPRDGLARSQVCITCTPARKHFIHDADVLPGTFIAAVGADSPDKQEIDPHLLSRAAVITDLTAQCVEVGDLHHAIAAGLMTREQVRGELGQIVADLVPGRRTKDEVIVFDATGTALQDVAAAAEVFETARREGRGTMFTFAGS